MPCPVRTEIRYINSDGQDNDHLEDAVFREARLAMYAKCHFKCKGKNCRFHRRRGEQADWWMDMDFSDYGKVVIARLARLWLYQTKKMS